jgi:peroxiredoxin Q/BCP
VATFKKASARKPSGGRSSGKPAAKRATAGKSAAKRTSAKAAATKKAAAGKRAPKSAAAKKSAGRAATMKAATLKTATVKTATVKKVAEKAAAGKESGTAMVESPLKVGAPAPDFSLPDDTGRTVTLGDFRGKKVVLYFYPKDATPGCTQESCDFRDNLARIGERGAVVLGLSADSVDSHKRFKAKQGLTFPLLSDPERKALEAYGVWQEKSLYGRKFMGIVRTTVILDEQGRVAKVFPKVKVGGHVDEVLASL